MLATWWRWARELGPGEMKSMNLDIPELSNMCPGIGRKGESGSIGLQQIGLILNAIATNLIIIHCMVGGFLLDFDRNGYRGNCLRGIFIWLIRKHT